MTFICKPGVQGVATNLFPMWAHEWLQLPITFTHRENKFSPLEIGL
jgi:hypothetical protein